MSKKKPRKSPYIPPHHEVVNKRERAPSRPSAGNLRGGGRGSARGDEVLNPRTGRAIEPPSLRRSLRRAPIAFIAFFLLQYFLTPNPPQQDIFDTLPFSGQVDAALVQGVLFTLVFIPLSLVMDRFMYRSFTKRIVAANADDKAVSTPRGRSRSDNGNGPDDHDDVVEGTEVTDDRDES